jgi:hypothetical protein
VASLARRERDFATFRAARPFEAGGAIDLPAMVAARSRTRHGVDRLREDRARTRNEERVMTDPVTTLTITLLIALLVIDRLARR